MWMLGSQNRVLFFSLQVCSTVLLANVDKVLEVLMRFGQKKVTFQHVAEVVEARPAKPPTSIIK